MILSTIKQKIILYKNYIIPNLNNIINNNIVLSGKYPKCKQKLIITGSGKIHIGEQCIFGCRLGGYFRGGCIEIQPRYKNSIIELGDNININNNVFICAANKITICDGVLIGHFVTIRDHEAHSIEPARRGEIGEIGEVYIGKNVWIGNNVIVLKNSFIGDNSIIAAGAVVTGKFPSNVIIGGVPAKIIKEI